MGSGFWKYRSVRIILIIKKQPALLCNPIFVILATMSLVEASLARLEKPHCIGKVARRQLR